MVKHGKMKGVVLYRLESKGASPAAVPLIRYDYATSSDGGDHKKSTFNKMDFVSGIASAIENNPPPGQKDKNKIGGFKVAEGDHSQAVYGVDDKGICYAVLTGSGYQSRIAISALEDLYATVQSKVGSDTLFKNKDLNAHKKVLKEFCKKYKTPEGVDKASAVLLQCEGVKGQMQDNISGMLKNSEAAGDLKGKTDTLVAEAGKYKKRTKKLKNTMYWKDKKQTCMLLFVVLLVFSLFFLPMILHMPFINTLLGGGGGGASEGAGAATEGGGAASGGDAKSEGGGGEAA